MQPCLVLVLCLAAAATAVRADADLGTLKVLHRVVDKCGDAPELFSCLKVKAVGLLDRALTVDTLPLNDYISINKDPKVKDATPSPVRTEGELEAALPRDAAKRSLILDEMLEERFNKYLDSRTIQLSMPAAVLEGTYSVSLTTICIVQLFKHYQFCKNHLFLDYP